MEPITPSELARAPAESRVVALVEEAGKTGWGQLVPSLRATALRAYESNSAYAPAWYYLYRWADLLATPRRRAVEQWIQAIDAVGGAHANMATRYDLPTGSLAAQLSPELQLALLSNPAFSEEFFSTIQPVDNPLQVLAALQTMHVKERTLFAEYDRLALAIAVVYDVPPPPLWPHGQVGADVLPRRLPAPEVALAYWARLDRSNLTAQRLRRLPASELKFIVDVVAPFAELDWARRSVNFGLTDFSKSYDLVHYRTERLTLNQFRWPGSDYRLTTILSQGGICVDQAYFASVAGKAKGIPTLLFRGAGLDGRHAWFGYLDQAQRWQLDAGRHADQRYVVGLAYDPQTWRDLNDHELLFLSERFRALPAYKVSVTHTLFAREYLRDGQASLALKAAREAVNRERRHLAAWEVLLDAQQAAAPADLKAREAILRDAALAFQKYPDLENRFARLIDEALRERRETSLADFEAKRLAQKYQAGRVDLSVQRAAETVRRSMQQDDLATQIRVFYRTLESSGRGASIDYFDHVVGPFARHLAKRGQVPAALQVLQKARLTLRVEPGKQLENEMQALAVQLRTGKVE